MFWRGKKKRSKGIDFSFEVSNNRNSFRITPPTEEPIVFNLNDRAIQVINIGAGGILFKCPGLKENDTRKISLELPGQSIPIHVNLKIIEVNPEGICRSAFIDISEEDADAIHEYMMEIQRSEIRRKKKRNRNR